MVEGERYDGPTQKLGHQLGGPRPVARPRDIETTKNNKLRFHSRNGGPWAMGGGAINPPGSLPTHDTWQDEQREYEMVTVRKEISYQAITNIKGLSDHHGLP